MPILRDPGSTPSLYQNHGLNVRFKRPFVRWQERPAKHQRSGLLCQLISERCGA